MNVFSALPSNLKKPLIKNHECVLPRNIKNKLMPVDALRVVGAILNRARVEGVVLYTVCRSREKKQHCIAGRSVVKMEG